jgi:hypothetical protein
MGKLNFIIPKGVPDWMKTLFLEMQNWSRNIDGSALSTRSVPFSALGLYARDIDIGYIDRGEWAEPLALAAVDAQTVSTAYVRCSPVYYWNPSAWGSGSWYLETYIAISNTAGTVTVHLTDGTSEITNSVLTHTDDTMLTTKRSETKLTMPTSAKYLYCEFKSSSGSYTASFAGARLIFIPY